jgi:integrase
MFFLHILILYHLLEEVIFTLYYLYTTTSVIRRFETFCNEKGVTDYTPEIGQAYADDVISKKTGKYSAQRHYSQGRFSRLLTSYYNTGIFDLAVMKRGRQEPSNDALKVLYREYEEHLREQYSNENTVLFYAYEVFCLFKYLESIRLYEIRDITAGTIVDYIKTTKQNRQRAILCGLRLYFTFINRQDLFAIVDGMHAYRAKRIIPLLNDGEIQKITDAIQSGAISNRDAAIVLFGLTTGIRAINLRLSDIDWDNETISFKQSKTGNYVFLPLTVSLGNAIARYLSEERPDAGNDYLFVRTIAPFDPLAGHTSCYAIVKSVFKTAGIRKDARIFGMHMLRHNAASTMVKNEVPISTIAAILGHADINSTDIYITTDEKKLRECVLPMTGISKEVFS